MSLRAYTPLLLAIVVIVAVLGMPLFLSSPLHHTVGCPFAPTHTAMCATNIFQHMTHWQTAFAAVFAELLVIVALALIALRQWEAVALRVQSFARIRMLSRTPDKPTLFQELFSQGILNRKEPHIFFVNY